MLVFHYTVFKYSMRVQVRLRRDGGVYRQPYGQGHTGVGQLAMVYRPGSHDRPVPVLRLLGVGRAWPELFEPRLVDWMGKEFKFLGWERYGRAWVLQEWDCEVLG